MARALVVGGANVDVKARTGGEAVLGTSNPGAASTTPGGVGRNIAEGLARLGTQVALVAAVGDDALGEGLLGATSQAGVDVSRCRRSAERTGSYTAVLDHHGELLVAVSDMAATDSFDPAVVDALGLDADLLVCDANLPPVALRRLLERAGAAGVPVVLEPVSVPKAARAASVLDAGPIDTVTPNRDELAALAGCPVTGLAGVVAAGRRLHARGVRCVWTHDATGSVLHTRGEEPVPVPSAAADPVRDVTGAGDALVAAYCHGLLTGLAPLDAAALGHRAATLTVESEHTVRPDLARLLS